MRKDNNRIILEVGDTLYRYDIEENLPPRWDSNYHNPEYTGCQYGDKNSIGAIFLYSEKEAAKQTLAAAINNQANKGRNINIATITSTVVEQEINLLDLSTGILECSNLISVLYELGIDVTTRQYFSYQRGTHFDCLHPFLMDLFSTEASKKLNGANRINEFFYSLINLLGQSLTDFGNGHVFKGQLEALLYEGYVFWEPNPISDTYCIFSPNKLSHPEHETIIIHEDEEMLDHLRRDHEGRHRILSKNIIVNTL